MATINVRFVFATGIRRTGANKAAFSGARLQGSWNNGRSSRDWSMVPMTATTWTDGCPAFEATVAFDVEEVNRWFGWGVLVDRGDGQWHWAVYTELPEEDTTKRERWFMLRAAPPGQSENYEVYHYNHGRRLGAQKYYPTPSSRPELGFGVWAPNAKEVSVVFGRLWKGGDASRVPLDAPHPVMDIAGGYVDDLGGGTHPARPVVQLQPEPGGYWFSKIGDPALADFAALDHKPYMVRVVKPDGKVAFRTDLYSRCQVGFGSNNPGGAPYQGLIAALDGSVSCSVVVDPDRVTAKFEEVVAGQRVWPETFKDTDEFWQDEFTPGRALPATIEDLVIYELHVGALGFGKPGPGTLMDAIGLLDSLVEMGVNAVELLPMSEFGSGDVNWGYSTSHYFALEFSGGGRDQYKYFVKECHQRGIVVIMDVVYNHYAHARERAQGNYDSNSPEEDCYFWHQRVWDRSVPNDDRGYIDNGSTGPAPRYWEEAVRNLFISSALTLVEEFHVDGFRVDLLNAIHRDNYLKLDRSVIGRANVAGRKFLREWTRALKLVKPGVFLMAEDHSEWPAVLESPDSSPFGMGFDYTWFSQFYHRLIGEKEGYLGRLLWNMAAGDDRELDLDAFAWTLEQSQYRHVVYHESHDEAGNADPDKPSTTHRTIHTAVAGSPLVGPTRAYAEARCRLVAGMSLLSAGTPMVLFGEEVGAWRDFKHHSILENREDLNGLRAGWGANLYRFYCDAIRFRRANRGLYEHAIKVVYVHRANRVLAFRRWGGGQHFLVVACFHNRPYDLGYTLDTRNSNVLPDNSWQEVFNSDSHQYGGDNVGNFGAVQQSDSGCFTTRLPANGFLVFRAV